MNLRDELMGIREANGELTPKLVVDAARKKDSPLHDRFEWNNAVAGEKYREVQAAELIRSVRVKYYAGEEEHDVRAFLAIPHTDNSASDYTPIEDVARDPIARALAIRDAEREYKAFRRRWSHLTEVVELIRRDLAAQGPAEGEATGS